MLGRRLSHYEILDRIGEGGMGVVYKARDTHLDRLVAIKILPADKVANPDRRRRFVQEAKSASALNHPGIVTIHDIAEADGVDFIAMELVAGQTLERIIPRVACGCATCSATGYKSPTRSRPRTPPASCIAI